MDRHRIRRDLAAAFEPKPDRLIYSDVKLISPLGFWRWSLFQSTWLPFDPFTSEDDCAKLLEAMPEVILCRRLNPKDGSWYCQTNCQDVRLMQSSIDPDRRIAVILAACKWKNIEVTE